MLSDGRSTSCSEKSGEIGIFSTHLWFQLSLHTSHGSELARDENIKALMIPNLHLNQMVYHSGTSQWETCLEIAAPYFGQISVILFVFE